MCAGHAEDKGVQVFDAEGRAHCGAVEKHGSEDRADAAAGRGGAAKKGLSIDVTRRLRPSRFRQSPPRKTHAHVHQAHDGLKQDARAREEEK